MRGSVLASMLACTFGDGEESDDEFRDKTTAPVPRWELLAGNRAVWVQLCQQLRLDHGNLG
jgi:hypothetical protein